MIIFQIINSMIDYLDLFLHYRHSAGESVMLAYLPRQLVNLRIRYRLVDPHGIFRFPRRHQAGDYYAYQGHSACDDRRYNCFAHSSFPLKSCKYSSCDTFYLRVFLTDSLSPVLLQSAFVRSFFAPFFH